MVSTKFYIYVFKFNSHGQIETSCGKEKVWTTRKVGSMCGSWEITRS